MASWQGSGIRERGRAVQKRLRVRAASPLRLKSP
jgi:hypothetical protein